MARAFTRESDNESLDEIVVEPKEVLPPGVKNYITPEGARRLRADLGSLVDERPRLREAIGEEPEPADKKRLRELDRKIRYLDERVSGLEIVEPPGKIPDRVVFGATVTVADEDGIEKSYQISGVDETDPDNGKVSWISPIARALTSRAVGDEVQLDLPRGRVVLEILKIE
jgi:transcription elongation factor GreB